MSKLISRRWVAYFFHGSESWKHLSLGFHIDFGSPNIEIHIPFGFFRIGRQELRNYDYSPGGGDTQIKPIGYVGELKEVKIKNQLTMEDERRNCKGGCGRHISLITYYKNKGLCEDCADSQHDVEGEGQE